MAGVKKPTALEAFEANIADAEALVSLARALCNERSYRMRREKREALGSALGIRKKLWDELDCVESVDVFLVLKPGGSLDRDSFIEPALRPLLRQAIVASAAALETYVADRVMELVGPSLRQDDLPDSLGKIPITLRDHLWVRAAYQTKPGFGTRRLVEEYVSEIASVAPSSVGKAFALVDQRNLLRRVDGQRQKKAGSTAAALERIADRRNRIAHAGDRVGRGRAAITVDEVQRDLDCIREVVGALDEITR